MCYSMLVNSVISVSQQLDHGTAWPHYHSPRSSNHIQSHFQRDIIFTHFVDTMKHSISMTVPVIPQNRSSPTPITAVRTVQSVKGISIQNSDWRNTNSPYIPMSGPMNARSVRRHSNSSSCSVVSARNNRTVPLHSPNPPFPRHKVTFSEGANV